MPNLRISTSGTQSVDTSRVDQAEAFRRQEAMRREQMQQQAIAQQLQARLAQDQLAIQREGLGVQRELGMGDINLRREMPGMQADAALRTQGGTGMDMQGAQFAHQQAMVAPQNELAMRRFQQEQLQRGLQMRLELGQLRNTGQISDVEYQNMMTELSGSAGGMPEQQAMAPQVQTGAPRSVHVGGARFGDPVERIQREMQSGEQAVGSDVDANIAQQLSSQVAPAAAPETDDTSKMLRDMAKEDAKAGNVQRAQLMLQAASMFDEPETLNLVTQANIERLMAGISQHFGASYNKDGETIWPSNPVKHREFLEFLSPMENMTQTEKAEYLQTFSDQRVRRSMSDVTTEDIPQAAEWFSTLNAELNKGVRSRDPGLMRKVIRDLTRELLAQGVDAVEIGRALERFEAAATESDLRRQGYKEVTKEVQALQGMMR